MNDLSRLAGIYSDPALVPYLATVQDTRDGMALRRLVTLLPEGWNVTLQRGTDDGCDASTWHCVAEPIDTDDPAGWIGIGPTLAEAITDCADRLR